MLEDLAAKVEDLEAAVNEKEATRKALRDALSQVAGADHDPTLMSNNTQEKLACMCCQTVNL